MKTVKNIRIGSFALDMSMYTTTECEFMLDDDKDIFYVNDEFVGVTDSDNYRGEDLRINHSACTEIKVIHDKKYGYMNVVKTRNGDIYYVQL